MAHRTRERADVFEELGRHLRMQIHCTVLELVEGSVIVLVNPDKILLEAFKFVLVLWILVNELLELEFKLCEIG